ncbi:unnamed protein product [Linum tenue]|uniref:Uncharacterized protein n=1 Tax=Linum tenue TaxID=586396 RepID=A0AAV0KHU1_9ROSI|nr:unnamed protein product [Linum tenue]
MQLLALRQGFLRRSSHRKILEREGPVRFPRFVLSFQFIKFRIPFWFAKNWVSSVFLFWQWKNQNPLQFPFAATTSLPLPSPPSRMKPSKLRR